MPQKCETRAVEARASRNSCCGCFRDLFNPFTLHWQFPIAASPVRPDVAMLLFTPHPWGRSS